MALKRKKGFSLLEVLLSMLIISIVLVIAIPVISKRSNTIDTKSTSEFAGFYYKKNNHGGFDCFQTVIDESGKTNVVSVPGKCEAHTFVVPPNVYKVDITLVAGGGGGGGAAGGTVSEVISSNGGNSSSSVSVFADLFKEVVINTLTGAGAQGGSANTTSNTSGAGGASGHAVVNQTISKKDLYNKFAYIPNWLRDNSTKTTITHEVSYAQPASCSSTLPTDGSFSGRGISITLPNSAKYAIFTKNSGNATNGVMCYELTPVNSDFTCNAAKTAQNCNLIKSYVASVSGKSGSTAPSTINSFLTVQGGEGGRITGLSSGYGAGGQGQGLALRCASAATSCTASSADKITLNQSSGGGAYGNVSVVVEYPGGVGAGGVGGSAVKIKDFSVIPGAKYTVVVGAGGAGGAKGVQGYNKNGAVKSAKAGSKGEGGSSTAIFDENGNLIYMVSGGIGGYGGYVNAGSGVTADTYPSLPQAARNIPLIISKSAIGTLNFDTKITNSLANVSNGDVEIPSGYSTKRVVYSYISGSKPPLYGLSANNAKILSSTDSSFTYDNLVGGFSAFNNARTNNDGVLLGGNYHGFYFRNLKGSEYIYSGGLGGFSGLGTKAGCGGYFVGNNQGTGNKFSINDSGTIRTYNVSEFYDNCTILTPDGKSATFEAPGGENAYYGSAGSGGGGGGFGSYSGAGKGGDGQDGYVFIEWRNK